MTTNLGTVGTIADLNLAITAANGETTAGIYEIDINSTIALGATPLDIINLASGVTLDIVGNGNTLDGGGGQRGLFVYTGTVDIAHLTLAHMSAVGGNGGSGGGGGAGLGGGLFLASGADVTLHAVTFTGDSATGGNGDAGPYTARRRRNRWTATRQEMDRHRGQTRTRSRLRFWCSRGE